MASPKPQLVIACTINGKQIVGVVGKFVGAAEQFAALPNHLLAKMAFKCLYKPDASMPISSFGFPSTVIVAAEALLKAFHDVADKEE